MAPKQEQESALLNPLVYGQDTDEDSESYHYAPPRRRRCSACRCVGWIFTLLSIIFISALSGAWISMAYLNIDQTCAAHTTAWSPVLKDVAIKYHEQPFDGNFMEENDFRKNGSAKVDEAWESLGVDYRPGVISYEDGIASGLTDAHVQVSPEHGGGFIVNVEGMHHLHCLNLVRKSLYFNYDHYKALGGHAFKNDGEVFRLHVTHCLDTIRQVLMCNVDTGVLGQVWYDRKNPSAFPDFNTKHTCKNYEDIKKWSEKLQAPPPGTLPPDFLADPHPEHVLEFTP
ncbi:hypothetical protein J7337_000208 [Fusarium musae]|uniref:Tat pathway signal sequence n=1 Tax=Fusarium musae TaxID=1042133 RepID=A0A9P8IUU5_9HYPO|nr:hypothetical protein J7337_000208 [Fusarium musae]KAG9506674.1 hypothetical protein J7337_000208 [Fusarium musae]